MFIFISNNFIHFHNSWAYGFSLKKLNFRAHCIQSAKNAYNENLCKYYKVSTEFQDEEIYVMTYEVDAKIRMAFFHIDMDSTSFSLK